MEYNYSLIIPHFNIPNLLRRLLRTIPKQNDLQVIVVDDCSTKELDTLYKVISEYYWVEWYDTGINGGGGKARNIGLQYAKGRYVFFADADDFFLPSIYDILEKFRSTTADVVFLNAGSLDTDTYFPSNRNEFLNYCHKIYDKSHKFAEFKLRYTFGEPWCRLIKRDIITKNHLKFQEIPCNNDTYFSYMVGHYANTIEIDSRLTYMVTFRSDSIINTTLNNRYDIMINVFTEKELFFIKNAISEHAYDPFDYAITEFIHCRYKKGIKTYYDLCANLGSKHVRIVLLNRFIRRILAIIFPKDRIKILN